MSETAIQTIPTELAEGYRQTELGLLPGEWGITQLQEIVDEVVSGDWGAAEQASHLRGVRALRGTDFARAAVGSLEKAPIRFLTERSIEKRQVQPGDALVELSGGSKDQPTGRLLLVPHRLLRQTAMPIVFSNFVKRLRVKQHIFVPTFFSYLWTFLYAQGRTRIYEKRTTGIRNFKLAEFLEHERVPVPPLPEQRSIAHVLRTVQKAKETTEQVIASTRELKRSLMNHLFTYGPVPGDEAELVPLKETEVGPVPEGWRVVQLSEVVLKTAQADPKKRANRRFRYVDVSAVSNDDLTIKGYVEHEGRHAPSRARKLIQSGDVIFATVRPYLRRIAKVPPELDGHVCSTAFCVIRARPDAVDSGFLFFSASTDSFVDRVSEHQRGSGYPAVTDKDVLSQLIPLPPAEEQREIALVLEVVDNKIAAEENRKQTLDVLFKTLLHNLMTGKVRVHDLDLSIVGETV